MTKKINFNRKYNGGTRWGIEAEYRHEGHKPFFRLLPNTYTTRKTARLAKRYIAGNEAVYRVVKLRMGYTVL